MNFHLLINTPNNAYFDGEVESLTISTSKGEITILANHQEMIANIEICKLLLKNRGNSQIFACGGGTLICKNNEVKLLLHSIEAQDEIDYERALREKEEAEKLKVISTDIDELKRAEYKIQKTINRLNIYNKDFKR